jgi:hypothetical protein
MSGCPPFPKEALVVTHDAEGEIPVNGGAVRQVPLPEGRGT